MPGWFLKGNWLLNVLYYVTRPHLMSCRLTVTSSPSSSLLFSLLLFNCFSSPLKDCSSTLQSSSLLSLPSQLCPLGGSSGLTSSSPFNFLNLYPSKLSSRIDAIALLCSCAEAEHCWRNTQSHTCWYHCKFWVCRLTWALCGFCRSLFCPCQLTFPFLARIPKSQVLSLSADELAPMFMRKLNLSDFTSFKFQPVHLQL